MSGSITVYAENARLKKRVKELRILNGKLQAENEKLKYDLENVSLLRPAPGIC